MQNASAPSASSSTDALTSSFNEELSRVDAHVGDTLIGFAAYEVCDDGTYSFHHTEVFEDYSGHGYGKGLAAGVMDAVRDRGVKIAPTCSFLRKYMESHPETHDLRAD